MSESYTAVGMVEFNSIAAGIDAADQMVKTAQVDPLFFKTICPGKFVAAVTGERGCRIRFRKCRTQKPMPMRWWTGSSSPTSTGR